MKEFLKEIFVAHVIVTEGVTRVYSDDGVPVHALRGIDLTIER